MAALHVLLLVPLLLAACAALEDGPRGKESIHTPQQSCSAHSWLEDELAHFWHPSRTATGTAVPGAGAAEALQQTPQDAAASAAAAKISRAYVEMTEAALEVALRDRP